MKNFLKYTLAAFVGAGLAFFFIFLLSFVFGIAMIGAAGASSGSKAKDIDSNSILKLELSGAIPERKNNIATNPMAFENEDVPGFFEMLLHIKEAKESSKIKGIFLDIKSPSLGHTQVYNLIETLQDFRESGKFIYAYSDRYSQHGYLLATVSDSIFMHPLGKLELKGYGTIRPYYKDFTEKLGVDFQIFNTGDHKSMGESYVRNEMSQANRTQTRSYLKAMQERLFQNIAQNRNLSFEAVDLLADEYMMTNAQEAIDNKLVDAAAYKEDVVQLMKDKLGIEDDKKLSFVSLNKWIQSVNISSGKGDKKIAVVFAEGNIIDNSDEKGIISDQVYVPLIDKLTQKENVAAMVLRVNSGGGSVMASENIYAAIQRFKDKGKKVIVSMGDVAASGGYYISMHSDYIFAEQTTITGSIGVVSVVPNMERLFEDKLNIYWDTVTTDPLAAGFNLSQTWTDKENGKFQKMTQEFYAHFTSKVSQGRNLPIDSVLQIAGGRVWTGAKALEIGLVDEIGSLEDAITKASELAELDEYKIRLYPNFKNPLMELLESFQGDKVATDLALSQVESLFPEVSHTMRLIQGGNTQAIFLDQLIY